MMNDVERLHGLLVSRFPDLKIEIDPPEIETGPWFVNVFRQVGSPVVVEWRADRGFGLATPRPDDYGTGVDEVFTNAEATFARVAQLVLSGGSSMVPLGVKLMEIRQSLGITQAELAATLGQSQAGVSKAEKRDDMQLGTLARHAAALGGSVSIRLHFPDGRTVDLPLPMASHSASSRPEFTGAELPLPAIVPKRQVLAAKAHRQVAGRGKRRKPTPKD